MKKLVLSIALLLPSTVRAQCVAFLIPPGVRVKSDEAHKTTLKVFVKKVDAGTRVKVNVTFQALREDQAIACYSNGTLEKALFEAMARNLGSQ